MSEQSQLHIVLSRQEQTQKVSQGSCGKTNIMRFLSEDRACAPAAASASLTAPKTRPCVATDQLTACRTEALLQAGDVCSTHCQTKKSFLLLGSLSNLAEKGQSGLRTPWFCHSISPCHLLSRMQSFPHIPTCLLPLFSLVSLPRGSSFSIISTHTIPPKIPNSSC